MSQEVFEIVKGMDFKAAETQLALHCAPLIAGIKASNLLIVYKEIADDIIDILRNTDISYCILSNNEGKCTILLYQKELLKACLMNDEAQNLLKKYGYDTSDFYGMLEIFLKHYKVYAKTGEGYPHEIGIFLGYPAEDVEGFIENDGKNFLCTGYWKVYEDMPAKIKLFEKYERARETSIQLISYGADILDIISFWAENGLANSNIYKNKKIMKAI